MSDATYEFEDGDGGAAAAEAVEGGVGAEVLVHGLVGAHEGLPPRRGRQVEPVLGGGARGGHEPERQRVPRPARHQVAVRAVPVEHPAQHAVLLPAEPLPRTKPPLATHTGRIKQLNRQKLTESRGESGDWEGAVFGVAVKLTSQMSMASWLIPLRPCCVKTEAVRLRPSLEKIRPGTMPSWSSRGAFHLLRRLFPSSSTPPPAAATVVVSPLATQFPIAHHQCQAARGRDGKQRRKIDCGRRVQEGFLSQGVADAALNIDMDMDAKSQGGPIPIPWTS